MGALENEMVKGDLDHDLGYGDAWFKDLATDCIKHLDIDGNGEIEYGEWEEFMKTIKKSHDKLDQKSNDKLTKKNEQMWKAMVYGSDGLQTTMKNTDKQIKLLAKSLKDNFGNLTKTQQDALKIGFEKGAALARADHIEARTVLTKLCNAVFVRIDTNKNGNLDKNEFEEFHTEFLANLGDMKPDKKVMDKLYSDMDKADGKEDGSVSQEEFVTFYVNHFCSKPLPMAKCKIDALTQVAGDKYKADMEKLDSLLAKEAPPPAADAPAPAPARKPGCSCVVS